MTILCGLDIHRKQITFDLADTVTGEIRRGEVRPADREHLARWLAQFAGQDAHFALEGCTGWRYVAEEITAAGLTPHLADPAELAGLRGPKRRAKTDRADARHERMMLQTGQLPGCWIPPGRVLDLRALLETYLDLRKERTAWVQRIHAVLYHHGTADLGGQRLGTTAGQDALRAAAAGCSPAALVQLDIAMQMTGLLDERLGQIRRLLTGAARHTRGPRQLQARLYGVGPVTALALTCWLGGAGRFSSSRQAVRFAGLDITVHSSDAKRAPGHLSRQGPPVLRWAAYESGKTHARPGAPHYAYYTQVKDRIDGKRAALSVARKIIREAHHILSELGSDAFAAC
jgi:transposase